MTPGCYGSVICHSPLTRKCLGCEFSDRCGKDAAESQRAIFGDNREPIMSLFVKPEMQTPVSDDLPAHTRRQLGILQRIGLTAEMMHREFKEGRNPLEGRGKKPVFLYIAFALHLSHGFSRDAYMDLLISKGMKSSSARSASATATNILNYIGENTCP